MKLLFQHYNIALAIWTIFLTYQQFVAGQRSFVIDYENDQFLKDGQPYRYISGSIHYFRVPRVHWQDRLNKMKAGGLNTIQTYVDWSQHEPEPGVYDFSDNLDIANFIQIANDTGLNVILRPGPYICAERDLGGLPYWLARENPDIVLRSSDQSYLDFVDRWYNVFFPIISPLLYQNGGPIISVQVENEYGSYSTCDSNYTTHLRDLFRSLLGNDTLLFTTDGAGDGYLKCGKIPEVYATVDFGPGTDVRDAFKIQKKYEPKGPSVNSEYYTGWLDHWGEKHSTISFVAPITLNQILAANASVSMYMYHGGTNFKFTNGANMGDFYEPDPTSYDYDAPISEAGDTTHMYFKLKEVIAKYDTVPDEVPPNVTKAHFGPISLQAIGSIFDVLPLVLPVPSINVVVPLDAAAYGQAYGFILYERMLTEDVANGCLTIEGIGDRGYVFIDQQPVGILDRNTKKYNITFTATAYQLLSILVENQGRIGYSDYMQSDLKGIVGDVLLDGVALTNWTMSSIPLNNTDLISQSFTQIHSNAVGYPTNLPVFYKAMFTLSEEPQDTFFDPTGWTKVLEISSDNLRLILIMVLRILGSFVY
ncbi:hypothetical protein CHUAL_009717 [Chamberlinius hualienensis]